uniref:Protein kinase domain-containing protein n=1 Tax=Parastrongyloides trichosuri TaxID=131310 RepID=A0A0N4Z8F4_PARTI
MDRIKPIQQDPWISENTTVDEKYKIHKMLSAGGFGQVYWGTDMTKGHYVAMKVEKKLPNDIPILALEAASMSEINKIMKKESIGRNQLVRLYDYLETSDLRILVMPLYGPNIRELKKSLSSDHFSLKTSLWLMKKMIGIIKILHAFGWVHRDIKPANFCIGLRKEDRHKLYLVDFGMAKTYQHENGSLKSKRHDCSFCGTARYASLDIHKGISFCRNDDLWSLYYITIENIVGQLPWRHTKDYKEIERMKESINLLSSVDKICNVPTCLYKFKEMLDKSSYYETPRYDFALQYIVSFLSINLLMYIFLEK